VCACALASMATWRFPSRRKVMKSLYMGTGVGVKYPKYRGSQVMAQNSGYDRLPPTANSWGTILPVSDKAPPLEAKEVGTPT
jgi:hypothetical protein